MLVVWAEVSYNPHEQLTFFLLAFGAAFGGLFLLVVSDIGKNGSRVQKAQVQKHTIFTYSIGDNDARDANGGVGRI